MKTSRLWLILASIPLGLMLSVAWQSRPTIPTASETSTRSVSASTILRLEEEQRTLKSDLKTLRDHVAVLQDDVTARRTQLSGLSAELAQQKQAAGLTALKGAGVRVTLDDSQGRSVPVGTDSNLLLVHDYDLRDAVGLLWANGATAIAINGQRLMNTTSIYCVGSTILVNDTRLSPPYIVEAVGPSTMQAAMVDPAAMSRFKGLVHQYGLGFGSTVMADVVVPAYDGRMTTSSVAVLSS